MGNTKRKPNPESKPGSNWGETPWRIDFAPRAKPLPRETDLAIVGGGFTGLAAAACARLLAPEKSVVVLESSRIGNGASGRTGGIVLAETAAGDLPGLGDVLDGFQKILRKLNVDCELALPGAWEIGRSGGLERSPIEWQDSGTLRVVKEVPGGTLDPGKLVAGLARAAENLGAEIFENSPVERIHWGERAQIELAVNGAPAGKLTAGKILLATNALSLGLAGLSEGMHPRLTLAALSAPLAESQLEAAGLSERKPFYTVDLPYLWGRVRPDRSIVWGAGLVSAPDERDLGRVDIASAEPARMFAALEKRVRGLDPALRAAEFTQRWGGPILFRDNWEPVFDWHPERAKNARDAIVLAAYAGHGVALSSYLGAWAAEVLLGKRSLPSWGRISS
jgi:glycine/D-amino acid oxidase-like deaminating enzyme